MSEITDGLEVCVNEIEGMQIYDEGKEQLVLGEQTRLEDPGLSLHATLLRIWRAKD